MSLVLRGYFPSSHHPFEWVRRAVLNSYSTMGHKDAASLVMDGNLVSSQSSIVFVNAWVISG